MGLIAAALGGLGEGGQAGAKLFGEYAAKSSLEEQAAQIQALRDQRLQEFTAGQNAANRAAHTSDTRLAAELAQGTHKANAQVDLENLPAKTRIESDAKVDVANRSPRTLAPGAAEVVDGKITVTAPDTKHPQQLLDYYAAEARRMNAMAAELERGGKEKNTLPSIKPEKDADGNVTLIDQNSGAVGTITAAKPGTPGVSHWFKPDELGTAATPPGVMWTYNGKPLPNGLEDLYPAIHSRASGLGGGGRIPPVPNATQAPDGNWYVPDPNRQGKWLRADSQSTPRGNNTQPPQQATTRQAVNTGVINAGSQSPLGRAADAVTGTATDLIETAAGVPARAVNIRTGNEALRAKISSGQQLTPQERERAIFIGLIKE